MKKKACSNEHWQTKSVFTNIQLIGRFLLVELRAIMQSCRLVLVTVDWSLRIGRIGTVDW